MYCTRNRHAIKTVQVFKHALAYQFLAHPKYLCPIEITPNHEGNEGKISNANFDPWTTSLCPVSSSWLLDPHTLGPRNLTMTRDFGLLGPAPNLAYYLGVSVISSETNMYYEGNRASGYTIFKVSVYFSVSGKRTRIRCPEVQWLSAT